MEDATLSIRTSNELKASLKGICAARGLTVSEWLRAKIQEDLASEGIRSRIAELEAKKQGLEAELERLNQAVEGLKSEDAALRNAVAHLKSEKKAVAQGAEAIAKEIATAIQQHTEEALTAFRALSKRVEVEFEKGVQKQVNLLSDNVKQLQDLDRKVREQSNELAFYLGRATEVGTTILLREKPQDMGFGEVMLYIRLLEPWIRFPGNDISIQFGTYDSHKFSEVFDCVMKALLKAIEERQGAEPNIRR